MLVGGGKAELRCAGELRQRARAQGEPSFIQCADHFAHCLETFAWLLQPKRHNVTLSELTQQHVEPETFADSISAHADMALDAAAVKCRAMHLAVDVAIRVLRLGTIIEDLA